MNSPHTGHPITWTLRINPALGFLDDWMCHLWNRQNCGLSHDRVMSTFVHALTSNHCPTQPRLAVLALLRCIVDDFACHFGIKCSSFSKMNIGTSRRSPCSSLGYAEYPSVQLGNILLERTVIICACMNENMFHNSKIFCGTFTWKVDGRSRGAGV